MKKMLALFLAILMVFSLAACGAKEQAPAEEKPATESTPAQEQAPAAEEKAPAAEEKAPEMEEVTLYVYMQDIDAIDAWNELLGNFMAEYPYITVELMDSQENYFATILATGDMPDIINPAMSEVAKAMIDAGLIHDISDTQAYTHMSQSYIDAETYNGVCLGVPQGAAFSTMFYNMKILEEAGWKEVPTNVDELLQCLADVTALGYDGLTVAGDKTTTCFMLYECILANYAGPEIAQSGYEQSFKDGTLDFTAYPEATKVLNEVAQYIMPGSTAYTEDDVVSAMASGNVAMCLAGNWSAGNICGAIATVTGSVDYTGASLPPFNPAGQDTWISVSPESVFAMSGVDEGEAHNNARVLLYEYIWTPENYAILQNARGVVPVIDNMPEELIVLDQAIVPLVAQLAVAPCVSMGFNLWTAEFKNVACTALNDVYAGNATADAAAQTMTDMLSTTYMNMG